MIRKRRWISPRPSCVLHLLLSTSVLLGSTIHPVYASTDTSGSTIMRGFPPAPEFRVTKTNAFLPPYLRWSMTHARELSPTRNLARARRPMSLPVGEPLDMGDVTVKVAGESFTLNRYLEESMTDGLIVVHRGRVIYERYLGSFNERQPHIWASMTKSVTGLLAAQFIAEGKLDPHARLATYVSELKGTPFGESSVRANLDMMVAVAYPESVPPDLGLFAATGLIPRAPNMPEDIYSFLKMAYVDGNSNQQAPFFYQNGSPEALAWALRRISGHSWANLVEERIWSRFAEEDAYVQIDQLGTEMASGGISSNLRDAARFAELVRLELDRKAPEDSFNQAVQSLLDPGDAAAFAEGNLASGRPGYSYRNYWFQTNDGNNSIESSGRFGQRIHINPEREMVVVQFATTPDSARRASSADMQDRAGGSAIGSATTFSHLVNAVQDRLPQ